MHPLLHLAIIWTAVFFAVVAARKTRLTPVLFFLFVGCVLVNIGVLPQESGDFIREFAELGIIFIMFALGFEESIDNFLGSLRKSWGIAVFGAIGPFVAAYFVADQVWGDTNTSLMCGLAMTATAVSLTMVSLRGFGLQKSQVATRIMTSAVLDDIGSLVMVAIVVPIAIGEGPATLAGTALIAGRAILFFVLVSMVGAWIFPQSPANWFSRVPILGRIGVTSLLRFDDGRYATLTLLLVALVVGLAATSFGFHPAVGAYMAGLIIREEYFSSNDEVSNPVVERHQDALYHQTKSIIDDAAFSWIGPVFFVDLGTKLLFDLQVFTTVLPYAMAMILGIVVLQVTSAALAARYTGGMNAAESLMIGFGMLGRAELAFVVMDIAYVQHSIIGQDVFYTLMITAFVLNVLVPVSIGWWQPYYRRAVTQIG